MPPANISRLLDPSYSSPPRPSSSSAYYVDPHDGDLHDPDYHIFPINIPKRRSSNYTMRPRWEQEDDDALEAEEQDQIHPFHIRRPSSFSSYTYQQHQRRSSSYAYSQRSSASGYSSFQRHQHVIPRLPHYSPHSVDSEDTALDEGDLDADDTESFMFHNKERSACSRIISRTKREFHKRRRSLESSPSPQDFTSPFSPPPPSPMSDVADPDMDAAPAYHPTYSTHSHTTSHHHPFTRTFSLQSHGRRSRASCGERETATGIPDASFTVEVDEDEDEEARAKKEGQEQYEWTPTCSQALRMQWQAIALRVRFSLFRTQKRLSKIRLTTSGRVNSDAW